MCFMVFRCGRVLLLLSCLNLNTFIISVLRDSLVIISRPL